MFNYTKYISLICLSFCLSAFGKNIVVLTSLPLSQIKVTGDLNQIIRKKLSTFSDYNLILKNQADQDDLYQALNDPDTLALFWLSHGAFKTIGNSSSPIKASSLLLDYNNDNVAEVFNKIHPNIQFIGIIGCNSAQILDEHISLRPSLGSYIPTKKVIATFGMRKSIRKFKKHYKKTKYEFIDENILASGFQIRITRENRIDGKSLKVFSGKEFIGILPKVKAGFFQDKTFYIPKSLNQKSKMKIIFKSGQSAFDGTDYLGFISIDHNSKELWKLFAKRDGTPFGTNERIFLFKTELSELSLPRDYILFNTSKY